jgi:hypothetical protein
VDGFNEEVSVTVGVALFTVCVSADDVLLLSLVSPPYAAVIEFDPTASVAVLYVAVLYVAFPLLIVPVPSVVLPFLNVTVPVAVEIESVAVKVTELPYVDGFDEEVSVTVGVALFTVCVNADDVLLL